MQHCKRKRSGGGKGKVKTAGSNPERSHLTKKEAQEGPDKIEKTLYFFKKKIAGGMKSGGKS